MIAELDEINVSDAAYSDDHTWRGDSFHDVAAAAQAFLVGRGIAGTTDAQKARAAGARQKASDGADAYSMNEFAALIGTTRSYVYHLIKDGKIKADKRYGLVFIPRAELEKFTK